MTWSNYYKEWTVEDFERHIKAQMGFIHRIQDHVRDGANILETGLGSGQISCQLSLNGYKVLGLDNDKKIVQNAYRLSQKLNTCPIFMLGDIFDLDVLFPGGFDMVVSQGVLEHFNDNEVAIILKDMLKVAQRVAFSVPLDKFGHQSYGNERLMPESYWLDKCKEYNILFHNTFADGKQMICIFEEDKK